MKNLDSKIKFDFIKRILTDTVQEDIRNKFFKDSDSLTKEEIEKSLLSPVNFKRYEGVDWPERAHTMIGIKRLDNLQFCVEDVLLNEIEGDLIETGVWRGGSCIFMKYILDELKVKHKKVYVADSFMGLPEPDKKYLHDLNDKHYLENYLKVDFETVLNNFKAYKVLDDNVEFLIGWFKDTLCNINSNKFCILRLDGDMYESTMQSLENLYYKLSIGGYIIIDDYCLKNCKSAVMDFREQYNIQDEIKIIDSCGIFWKKETEIKSPLSNQIHT